MSLMTLGDNCHLGYQGGMASSLSWVWYILGGLATVVLALLPGLSALTFSSSNGDISYRCLQEYLPFVRRALLPLGSTRFYKLPTM